MTGVDIDVLEVGQPSALAARPEALGGIVVAEQDEAEIELEPNVALLNECKEIRLAHEVTILPDLDDALGNPFQNEFLSQLKDLCASPGTSVNDITSSLDDAHQETISDNS